MKKLLGLERVSAILVMAIVATTVLTFDSTQQFAGNLVGTSPVLNGRWSVAPGRYGMQKVSVPTKNGMPSTAVWTFHGLEKNTRYEILSSWAESEHLSSNAVYRLYDGRRGIGMVSVDQRESPQGSDSEAEDETFDGTALHAFQRLAIAQSTTGELRILLTGDSSESVAAGPLILRRYSASADLSLIVTTEQVPTEEEPRFQEILGFGDTSDYEHTRYLKYTIRVQNDGPEHTLIPVKVGYKLEEDQMPDDVSADIVAPNMDRQITGSACQGEACEFKPIFADTVSQAKTIYVAVRSADLVKLCGQDIHMLFFIHKPNNKEYTDPNPDNDQFRVDMKGCNGTDMWIDAEVKPLKRLPPEEQEILPAGLHLLQLNMTTGNNGPTPLESEMQMVYMNYYLERDAEIGNAYLTKFRPEGWIEGEYEECDDYGCLIHAPGIGETVSRTLVGHIGDDACGKNVRIGFKAIPSWQPNKQGELIDANNEKTVEAYIWCKPYADLSIQATSEVSPETGNDQEQEVTYSVTITNNGPRQTPALVFTDYEQSEGPPIVFSSSDSCEHNRCSFPALSPGESASVDITGLVRGEGLCDTNIVTHFRVGAEDEDGFDDPNPDNNESVVVTSMRCNEE
jgi:hypothetical protein